LWWCQVAYVDEIRCISFVRAFPLSILISVAFVFRWVWFGLVSVWFGEKVFCFFIDIVCFFFCLFCCVIKIRNRMIKPLTYLSVADNSGARLVQCIQVVGSGKNRGYGELGDRVVVAVKSTRSIPGRDHMSGVQKGSVMKGVIIRTKKRRTSPYLGSFPMPSFGENSVVLLSAKGEVYGSRVFGPVDSFPLRRQKQLKILSLARSV
jgi:large subunit ribosomal protein L14